MTASVHRAAALNSNGNNNKNIGNNKNNNDINTTEKNQKMNMNKKRRFGDIEEINQKRMKSSILSLLDISAKIVASNYPYQNIEERLKIVPGPVQQRILFYSFPQNESSIALYSSNFIHVNVNETHKQPYQVAVKLVESNSVSNVMQIGYHLSGTVQEKRGICNKQKTVTFKCSMTFDRNCITSKECSCDNKSLLWCSHVVAVAVYRIRNPFLVPIKPPLSDTVIDLKKDQLQKLILLLTSRNQNQILPDVQNLLDDLRKPDSEINGLVGLPDPTAGGCFEDKKSWHIDNESVRAHIKTGLLQGNISKNIISLMNKVREMISAYDDNYVSLLISITDSIMNESKNNEEIQRFQRTRRIFDELQSLWFCVMLNPTLTKDTSVCLENYLSQWYGNKSCPKENKDDPTSKNILESVQESITKNDFIGKSASIESYNLVNKANESLRIAQQLLNELKHKTVSTNEVNLFDSSIESVSIVYNALMSHKQENNAFEWALICLCQSWTLPHGEYAQNRLSHRYEQFLSELENLDFNDTNLQNILLHYSKDLYKKLKLILQNQNDILPNHCFIRFLFERLIDIDPELAFSISHLMLPLSRKNTGDSSVNNILSYNGRTTYITAQLEYQQAELAASLLKNCEKNRTYLKPSLATILQNVRQFEHLYRLAKLCRDIAGEENDVENLFLTASFELGVQCLQVVSESNDRKVIVRWLISCAVDLGKEAVEFLVHNWTELFTPKEIANDVSPVLTSQPVLFKLHLTNINEKEYFMRSIRNMLIEGCIRDPVPTILFSMTLCEDHPQSFELIFQICYESQEKFNPAQLFSVARYLENKKHAKKAYKLAVQALKRIDLGALDTQHPAVCDILWMSLLASNLGMDELTQIVPIIENCIRNPLVLTEIAEKCSNPIYFSSSTHFCCNKEPLNRIVALAQKLFVEDIELKLQNITRKNYSDFVDYLKKIKRAFLLSDDGLEQFHWLIDYIMMSQKGKKKLHQSIKLTFLS